MCETKNNDLRFALWETGRMMEPDRSRGGTWEETAEEREIESTMVETPFRDLRWAVEQPLVCRDPEFSAKGVGLGRWLR